MILEDREEVPELTQTALLIGGPADGRRVQVLPGLSYYEVVIPPPPATFWRNPYDDVPIDLSLPRHVYRRVAVLVEGFAHTRRERCIFIHSSINPVDFDVFRYLFNGYHQENSLDNS